MAEPVLRSAMVRFVFLSFILLFSPQARADEPTTVIALIGDSTVTDSSGWGKAFASCCNDGGTILNFSVGGRSAKSWFDEGRLPEVLAAKPDFLLIQFGHNGQPGKGPKRETDPATTYREYLRIYISEAKKIGATPVLISSVVRRGFDESGKIRTIQNKRVSSSPEATAHTSLFAWADAARIVAEEEKIPFIDLHSASLNFHNEIGPEASALFNPPNKRDPKRADITHFNEKGAAAIANLVVGEIRDHVPALVPMLKAQ